MAAQNLSSASLGRCLLKVAVVGLPNAGKSTLINTLLSTVVCPVSKRVHTTRLNQYSSYLDGNCQVVLVDTPGLLNVKEIKKFSFPRDFVFGPENSIRTADLVAVVHDVSNTVCRNKLDLRMKGLLEKFPDKNCILILNKIDTVKNKNSLLDTVRIMTCGVVDNNPLKLKKSHLVRMKEDKRKMDMENLLKSARMRSEAVGAPHLSVDCRIAMTNAFLEEEIQEGLHLAGWPKFHDVFMTSAVNNDGVDSLKQYFVLNAKPCSWMFEEDFLTDVPPKDLTVRVIRALLLDQLPQEMPYNLNPKVEFWERSESGELKVIVQLECPNSRYVGRVVGTGGVVIRNLCQRTESILGNLLQVPVNLVINPYSVEKQMK